METTDEGGKAVGVRLAALDFPKHMRTTVVSPFSARVPDAIEAARLLSVTTGAPRPIPITDNDRRAARLRGAKRGNAASNLVQRSGNVKASSLPWNWSRMVMDLCNVARMTRVAIAEYCGCDRSMPGQIAHGKARPGPMLADKLVRLYRQRIGPELPR